MILKHRDTEVLRFDWILPFGVKNVEVNPDAEQFLPLVFRDGFLASDARRRAMLVEDWLMARLAPIRRQHIERMMNLIGLDFRDPRLVIEYCKGLSLNDVHWVDADDSRLKWTDCNLYANDFSKVIAEMAFTGQGKHAVLPDERSPEFTTNGALPKCWRRINGQIFLFKGASEKVVWDVSRQDGFGVEPFSEFYASQVAEAMELNHVPYGLAAYHGTICSTCPLFTSDCVGFIAAKDLPDRERLLSNPVFAEQFLFDAIIFNTDRHWGNFGFLVDNDANELVGPAPIFDNGYGLFSQARYLPGKVEDEFSDLRKFVARKSPVLYPDWLGFPGGLTDEMIDRVRKLKGFHFRHHREYRLPEDRIRVIQYFVNERIANVIKFREKADRFIKIGSLSDTINCKDDKAKVTHPAEKIKSILKNFPTLTRTQLAQAMGVSSATVARHLKSLQDAGELVRIGSRKTGYWEVR